MMQTAEPSTVGIDPQRLEHFFSVVDRQVAVGQFYGGAFLIARHGSIVAARGVGQTEPTKDRSASPQDIFCILSLTKPISATMLLMQVDQGNVRLIDRVADYIPEFAAAGKGQVTVAQVLTHTAGFPTMAPDWPLPNWADWEGTIARICAQPLEYEPGTAVSYHTLTGSWILAEIARRIDGGQRSFVQMCAEDLYQPLGMTDSALGLRPDMHERLVPIQPIDQGGVPFPLAFLDALNTPEIRAAGIPGAVSFSTVYDVARFFQMWLNGGELAGVRLLSPALVDLATMIHTGDQGDRLLDILCQANDLAWMPANRGLAFFLRGSGIFPSWFGTLASPRTFGHAGASSIMAWADPARQLIFVGLTAGLIEERKNIPRWHLFSDLVQACVVD